jgi:hypothetical protein
MEPWLKHVISGAIIGGVLGSIGGGITVLLIGVLSPRKLCPVCKSPLPKVGMPTSLRQALWGGWTCPNCGCQVDWRGREVKH